MRGDQDTPQSIAARIRAMVRTEGVATRKALMGAETALVRFPGSATLWCLRGNLIQLSDDVDTYDLEDAERSYLKAAELEPANPEPVEELGHFYDAIMDDPARAEPFFRKAISLGGGRSAEEGLAQVLEQLGSGSQA